MEADEVLCTHGSHVHAAMSAPAHAMQPENIVIEGGAWGGRVFLVDFGGVQGVAADVTSLGSTVIGTYGYMAPEQFQGNAQVRVRMR